MVRVIVVAVVVVVCCVKMKKKNKMSAPRRGAMMARLVVMRKGKHWGDSKYKKNNKSKKISPFWLFVCIFLVLKN